MTTKLDSLIIEAIEMNQTYCFRLEEIKYSRYIQVLTQLSVAACLYQDQGSLGIQSSAVLQSEFSIAIYQLQIYGKIHKKTRVPIALSAIEKLVDNLTELFPDGSQNLENWLEQFSLNTATWLYELMQSFRITENS